MTEGRGANQYLSAPLRRLLIQADPVFADAYIRQVPARDLLVMFALRQHGQDIVTYQAKSYLVEDDLCPPGLLGLLSADLDRQLRVAAARHPNCPPPVLGQLLQDPDREVSRVPRAARAMWQLAYGQ